MKRALQFFADHPHDRDDPSAWLSLFVDRGLAFHAGAKAAFLYDSKGPSRQFFHPVVKLFARTAILLIQGFKILWPSSFHSPRFLHKLLYWGMKYCLTPEANYLILRHFNLGTEILGFLADNARAAHGIEIPRNPLRPVDLEKVKDNLFLDHDLNLFNFVIDLNRQLAQHGVELTQMENPVFDSITDGGEIALPDFAERWSNLLDLASAIEVFTPLYQLFLRDNDFWRAAHSLQFDEVIGGYAASILGTHDKLALINNKHPMVPLSTLKAGYRLVLHGLATESLHALLVRAKKAQQEAARVQK